MLLLNRFSSNFKVIYQRSFSSKRILKNDFTSFWEDETKCPTSWITSFQRDQIPYKNFQIAFNRSGGPGGQNVNKVSTKAELRFGLSTASWLPKYIRRKMKEDSNRVNKNGDYIVTSSRNRTQLANVEDCIDKIYEDICKAANTIPKPTDPLRQKRIDNLKKMAVEQNKIRKVYHSNKKASRRGSNED